MSDWSGRVLELAVGAPGHGGFCVARAEGRVVFVRHALPGERVRAVVTEDAGGSFCRADAIEVSVASPDRVAPPCPHAGPGRCGGCDWQHASASAQRRIKAHVVREQFARVAGIEIDLDAVEELPGGLLGWRNRVTYAVAHAAGTGAAVGLHRHRSRELEPLRHCPLGMPGVDEAPAAPPGVTGVTGLEVARDDDGVLAVLVHRPGPGRQARGRRPPDRVEVVAGPHQLRYDVAGRMLEVSATGFWQVHPHALETFTTALLDVVAPRPGETVLDLYAGAGAITSVLADAVGRDGTVLGVESSRQAVADAAANLADRPWASVVHGRVDADLVTGLDLRPDLVVLDPPRAGAGRATMAAVLEAQPRCVGYVSCDPATLARDTRTVLDHGWRLTALRAFDAFPMTHHVECVACFEPTRAQDWAPGRYTNSE